VNSLLLPGAIIEGMCYNECNTLVLFMILAWTAKGAPMRSELLKEIFEAFAQGNKNRFLDLAYEVIQDEERKHHHLLARDLKDILKTISNGRNLSNHLPQARYKDAIPIPRDTEKGFPLLEVKEFFLDWTDIILDQKLEAALTQVVDEIRHADILATYGLPPKQKILLCGPPGTGKTFSAQIISAVLGYRLIHIRFDSIISSFLGETAANLRKIFDFINYGQWIVLFDEFDIIGKHRDDHHEHGEIKRVVNNFMQMLDDYTGESLLIATTNHHHLLDPGLWRRFDEILFFNLPDANQRCELLKKYLRVLDRTNDISLETLAAKTQDFSAADIARVCREALKKTILEDKKKVGLPQLDWAINEQNRRKTVEKERRA